MQRILVPLLGLLPCLAQIPAPPQQRPIALVNARLYTVSHGVIENGTLLFANGRILAVGRDVPVPDTAVRIDCAGKRVYPGFITAASRLGLVEIDAVRATRDYAEVGEFNPNITAATAFNVESEIIPTVRSNGILLAHVMPEGGLISGRSSIMLLDGWTAPEATLKAVTGVVVRMPERPWWEERRSAEQRYRQQLQRLYDFLEQARQYSYAVRHGAARPTRDLRLEAMRAVFEDSLPLFVHANRYEQIQEALRLKHHFNVRMVLVGAADAWRCLEELRQADVPVILVRTHRLPLREEEPIDMPYRLPALLEQAGLRFAIAEEHSWPQRNLPFNVGTAIAHGLSEDAALRSITLWAAEILGIADRVGSLEPGKDATLFICSGDPFDVRTLKVERAFIQGRELDLTSRHTRLEQKYRQRYRQPSAQ